MRSAAALGLLPVTRYVVACGGGSDGLPDDGLPRYSYDGPRGPETTFSHGVASGDPLSDAVILWTRVSPPEQGAVDVFFEVSLDPDFRERVAADTETTDADRDYTVKLDVGNLEAGTTYYYRFSALGRTSITGRTRTAPKGEVDRLRFAVVSCSNYGFGYFHGYRDAAQRADIDAVIHLGDYIYEYQDGTDPSDTRETYGTFRELQPHHEAVTLGDYRTRYAYYHTDPDLQAVHQQHPFIAVWDDHELANDAWKGGAKNHNEDPDFDEGSFDDRRLAAARAYAEWIPIRDITDGRVFRGFSYGDLVDLIMLDTRLWGRDQQIDPAQDADRFDEARSLLGDDQETWLSEQLDASTAKWCLIGQQVVMSQLQLGADAATLNPDSWDGYVAARQRFFDALRESGRDNFVVLTGDIHASAVADLAETPFDAQTYDPDTGQGALAVELVTPGITSPFPLGPLVQMVVDGSPHLHWANGVNRGYMLLDVTADRVQGDWYHYPDPEVEDAPVEFEVGFSVADGTPHAVQADAAVEPAEMAPALAPVKDA